MKNEENSILSGILKYSVSTWINLVLGFGAVIITTRLLSPDIYGQISLFLSTISVLMYIAMMGMDGALLRFYNEPPGSNTISQLIYKNIFFLSVIIISIGLSISFIAGNLISELAFHDVGRIICVLLVIQTWSQIILRFLNISYRMSFQVRKYTIQNVLLNCISRISIIVGALISKDFFIIITVSTIAIGTTTVLYLYFQRKDITPIDGNGMINYSLHLRGCRPYLKYALFCAPTYIVANFNNYVSQQIILSLEGSYALGLFASNSMFGQILMVVKGGFGNYWAAFVYKNFNNQKEHIMRMHDYIVLISIIVLSILICARDFIFLFIGSSFHESKQFFSLLLLSSILTFIMETTGKGLEIAKKNHLSLLGHILSVVCNIVGCYYLIKDFGLWGAALASALSALVLYLFITFWSQRYYKTISSTIKSFLGLMIICLQVILPSIDENIEHIYLYMVIADLMAVCIYLEQIRILFSKAKRIFK